MAADSFRHLTTVVASIIHLNKMNFSMQYQKFPMWFRCWEIILPKKMLSANWFNLSAIHMKGWRILMPNTQIWRHLDTKCPNMEPHFMQRSTAVVGTRIYKINVCCCYHHTCMSLWHHATYDPSRSHQFSCYLCMHNSHNCPTLIVMDTHSCPQNRNSQVTYNH